jgi:hypothetical protein
MNLKGLAYLSREREGRASAIVKSACRFLDSLLPDAMTLRWVGSSRSWLRSGRVAPATLMVGGATCEMVGNEERRWSDAARPKRAAAGDFLSLLSLLSRVFRWRFCFRLYGGGGFPHLAQVPQPDSGRPQVIARACESGLPHFAHLPADGFEKGVRYFRRPSPPCRAEVWSSPWLAGYSTG